MSRCVSMDDWAVPEDPMSGSAWRFHQREHYKPLHVYMCKSAGFLDMFPSLENEISCYYQPIRNPETSLTYLVPLLTYYFMISSCT